MTTQVQPVPMKSAQAETLEGVLTRAFWDDPIMNWFFPDPAKRERPINYFFRVGLRYGMRWGDVLTTESGEGASVWLPPGATKMTVMRSMRAGFGRLPFVYGIGAFRRLMKVMTTIDPLHERDVPEPHWYLFILGVDLPRQGQGIGSALMAPHLAKADADGVPCYLETSLEKDVVFYQRHGFEVVVHDSVRDGPEFWTMKRPPQ
jgi:GNAT superfamily N-acetyltransferase